MKPLLLLSFGCSIMSTMAQVPTTEWSRTAGGFYQYEPYRSEASPTGGFFTCGYGEAVRDFGGGVTVADSGFTIARYGATGDILWARPLTTEHGLEVHVHDIAINSFGDLWLVGYFNSATLVIDGFTLNTAGGPTAFMARFDGNGDAQFAKAWGEDGYSTNGHGICTDALDRVYVIGSCDAPSLTVDAVTLVNTGVGSQVVAFRFDENGMAEGGAISSNPLPGSAGLNIAVDGSGNVYSTVRFNETLVVNGVTLSTSLANSVALTKFTSAGDLEWMHAVAVCDPLDLTLDLDGNAYVCGDIQAEADFDGDILVPSVLDGFVSAYTGTGEYRWVVGVQGDIDNELCWSVALDSAQTNLIVGGTFVISASFGGVPMSTGSSPTDGFVMHMDTAGTVNWVKDMTGDGPTLFAEAHFDAEYHIFVSGVTQSLTTYLGEPVLNVNGNQAFLARFGELTTGVPLAVENTELRIRPNPSSGAFTIDLTIDARVVIITDALGRTQQQIPVADTNVRSFHIGTPGVYFVTV
ncbi:MAG TPA: T9SS type A sorting domain-containing protein, partial [Flavobacteriales bacterium]|nr:T9SS type A sorting domain-containing protein [Flavobacteriales bacterium]